MGRLLDHIRTSGLMDSSYIVITSDHGEMFERGVVGHNFPSSTIPSCISR